MGEFPFLNNNHIKQKFKVSTSFLLQMVITWTQHASGSTTEWSPNTDELHDSIFIPVL